MKKRLLWAGAALLLILLCGVAARGGRARPLTDGQVDLIVATDLHYLTPEYREEGSMQLQMSLSFGDGKQVIYQEELTDAFFDEVIAQKPTALVLLGDLSYNGEEASHLALAQKLGRVREAGVPVYLIPGNHDINIYNARAFYAEGTQPVPSVTPERFDEIYAGCSEEAVLSRDKTTRSFVAALSPRLRLLMLDGALYRQNTKGSMPSGGELSEETLAWAESCQMCIRDRAHTPLPVLSQSQSDSPQ